jgi:hypothetical protein
MCVHTGPPPTIWETLWSYMPVFMLFAIGTLLLFVALKHVSKKSHKVNLIIIAAFFLVLAILGVVSGLAAVNFKC